MSPINPAVAALLTSYDQVLQDHGAVSRRHDNARFQHEQREHLRWMIETMLREGDDWSMRKFNRWLGFIQGQLQAHGLVTLQDLRDQSRKLWED